MSDEYLPTDREGELLATILVELPGPGDASGAGDRILCELIEMGLADPDVGPVVYAYWCAMPAERDTDDHEQRRTELADVYRKVAKDGL